MGCILEKTAYEWEITVDDLSVDRYNRLRLSELLKLHQKIGEMHLNEFGTYSDELRDKQDLAFIFTKIKVLVHKMPRSEQKIKLTTWCSELKGIRFYRNYRVSDQNGEILTEAKAEVTVISLADRKIVRPKEIKGFDDFLYNTDLQNGCEKPIKINVVSNTDKKVIRPTKSSDIDENGHINNTVYADIVLECLDNEDCARDITGFEINYLSEVKPEETLGLSVFSEGDSRTVAGFVGSRHSFTAKIEF